MLVFYGSFEGEFRKLFKSYLGTDGNLSSCLALIQTIGPFRSALATTRE